MSVVRSAISGDYSATQRGVRLGKAGWDGDADCVYRTWGAENVDSIPRVVGFAGDCKGKSFNMLKVAA
jgi:hypothetical protein